MPSRTPFVLRGRIEIRPASSPDPNHVYDSDLQLWVDQRSGEPLVTQFRRKPAATPFGETAITESGEGSDQPEVDGVGASTFGETTFTKASEGSDQPEEMLASPFGETRLTATREGADTSELSFSGEDAADTNV